MKILDHKDAINRRQDERLIIVETAIHRVSWRFIASLALTEQYCNNTCKLSAAMSKVEKQNPTSTLCWK